MTRIDNADDITYDRTYVVQIVDLNRYTKDRLHATSTGAGRHGVVKALGKVFDEFLESHDPYCKGDDNYVPDLSVRLQQAVDATEAELRLYAKATDQRSKLLAQVAQIDADEAKRNQNHYEFFAGNSQWGHCYDIEDDEVDDERVADLVAENPDVRMMDLFFNYIPGVLQKENRETGRELVLVVQDVELMV